MATSAAAAEQQLTEGMLALRVDAQWMQQYEATDERRLSVRVVVSRHCQLVYFTS